MTLSELMKELAELVSNGYGDWEVTVTDLDRYETGFEIYVHENFKNISLEAR